MKVIWRFEFPITDTFFLEMPEHANILTAFIKKNGQPSMWAEVNSHLAMEKRSFAVVGTGNPMPTEIKGHIASFEEGQFIWHLYEINPWAVR